MTWSGGAFGERARCVLAPNASVMTLDGTNTWVLREPDSSRSVVVDPGPSIMSHLDEVESAAGDVATVLLTHHHADHAEAAREFAERVGCGVRALDPAYRLGSEGLNEGDVVSVDGLEIRVVATPGHSSDSLSFVLPAEGACLTGDTVLGRGTTVVAHPDGQLGAYLDSLDRLHALASEHEITTIWPGHGPVIDEALPVLDYYRAHRRERLEQVEAAVAQLRDAPHPNAARVFLNFLLSEAGQTLLAAEGFRPAVSGYESKAPPEVAPLLAGKLLGTTTPGRLDEMTKLATEIYK